MTKDKIFRCFENICQSTQLEFQSFKFVIGEEAESFRFVLPCEKQEDFSLDYSYTPVLPIDKMDGWSTLILNYSTKWPLHLLFTPAVMDRYNTIFRFLLKVKRTQYDLHHIWLGQRSESYLYRFAPFYLIYE